MITIVSYSVVCVKRRMSWYACALIMLESTTPFGNFRYLMSKSDDKNFGKSSPLYMVNAAGWLVSHARFSAHNPSFLVQSSSF